MTDYNQKANDRQKVSNRPRPAEESHSNTWDTQPDSNANQLPQQPRGIDTIQLLIEDFTVVSDADLELRESSNPATGETDDRPLYRLGKDGPIREGKRAFTNLPDRSGDSIARVTIRALHEMYLAVELPRLLRKDNLTPIKNEEEFSQALKILTETLRQRGIRANVLGAKIIRLDICQNVETEAPLSDYKSLFDRLSFPRADRNRYEDNGVVWRNGSRQLLVYAKGEKCGLDEELQRVEYRLNKARSVRRHVGVETISDLVEHFGRARDAYEEAAQDLLPEEGEAPEVDPACTEEALTAGLEAFAEVGGSPYSKTLQALGIRHLLQAGQTEAFLNAVQAHGDRKAKNRYRNKIEDLAPIAGLLSEEGCTDQDRLAELRDKLLQSSSR